VTAIRSTWDALNARHDFHRDSARRRQKRLKFIGLNLSWVTAAVSFALVAVATTDHRALVTVLAIVVTVLSFIQGLFKPRHRYEAYSSLLTALETWRIDLLMHEEWAAAAEPQEAVTYLEQMNHRLARIVEPMSLVAIPTQD